MKLRILTVLFITSISLPSFAVTNSPQPDGASFDAGEFVMGDSYCEDEQGGSDWCADETPHRVALGGFTIGKFEITHAQYQKCFSSGACGPNMLHEDRPAEFSGPNQPVVFVTHADAVNYCKYSGGRLPTEAEWERGARADNLGGAHFGKEYDKGAPRDVGQFHANSYGLHDMMGNVNEWMADWYGPLKTEGVQTNPQGPPSGKDKVVRGGSWNSPSHFLRPSDRVSRSPELRYSDVGFRCVRSVSQK